MARGRGGNGDYDVNRYSTGDMARDMAELEAATRPEAVTPAEVVDTQWIGGHGSDRKDKEAAEKIAKKLAPAAARRGLVIGVAKAPGRDGGYNVTVERPAKRGKR